MKAKFSLLACLVFGLSTIGIGFFLGGCSSSTGDSDSSGSLQVTMSVSPSSITVGEAAVIEAVVSDGTDPLSNRIVNFTASPAGSGYFTPSVDTSDASGLVSSVFTALTDGNVTISATISGGSSHDDFSLSIGSQSHTSTGNIDLVIVPTIILADGASTSQLTITIRDQDENPAPDGTTVKLTAGEKFIDLDGNGYWTAGVDSLAVDINGNETWDAIGYIPASATVSGGAGQVIVNYTAGTEASTVYFTITVDDDGITGYAEASIQLTPDATVASIAMYSDDIHLAVKRTGRIETSTLRAVGYDAYGNTVPEGLQISFIITDGPDDTDDGEHLATLAGVNRRGPYVATTNSMGQASCPISSGTVSGTIRVRAYVDTVLSNSTQIMVHAGPPARIVVGSQECNVPYWGWVNETVEIIALVSDIYNNPCADSTVVYFTCDEGVIKAHESRTEQEEGLAPSVWISYGGEQADGDDGIIELIAETSGGTLADTGYFINSWYPDTIWFVTYPTNLNATDESRGYLFVEVRDLNMNYCVDLEKIKFESEYVSFIERENGDGCYSSGISNTAQGKSLDQDFSMNGIQDDGIGAIDFLTARYGFMASAAVPCTLRTGFSYSKLCVIDIASSVPTGSVNPFSVTVKDRWGNPLGDHEVEATLSGGGSLANTIQTTDTYGEAGGFEFTAPGVEETVVISITDNDPRGGVIFSVQVSVTAN